MEGVQDWLDTASSLAFSAPDPNPNDIAKVRVTRAHFLMAWKEWCDRQPDPAVVISEIAATAATLTQLARLAGVRVGGNDNGQD